MSTTFWCAASASWLLIAMGPWQTPQSYGHQWFDAIYFSLAVFGALKAITSAIASVSRQERQTP